MDEKRDVVMFCDKGLTMPQLHVIKVQIDGSPRHSARPVPPLLMYTQNQTPRLWHSTTPSRTQKSLSPTTTLPFPCIGFIISNIVVVVFPYPPSLVYPSPQGDPKLLFVVGMITSFTKFSGNVILKSSNSIIDVISSQQ
jgi:hypothetical protein